VISSGARRRWTLDEKQRVVAESYAAPRQLSATARRNGLSAACLFTKRLERGRFLWPSPADGAISPAQLG